MLPDDPRRALARRLRALREEHWPGLGITQHQLAEAFGGGRRPLSISLISSWENMTAIPPARRLEAYATFFATMRSVETNPYRLLLPSQLTEDERATRDALRHELFMLRDRAATEPGPITDAPPRPPGGFWHFNDENIITIVCAQLPQDLLAGFSYADPTSPDYVALYTYADLDALIELYGHIRMVNPNNQVYFKTAPELVTDDYTSHLVLLGGVDWNFLTRDLLKRVELPVRQVARADEQDIGGFEVRLDNGTKLFAPQLDRDGQLVEDVGHFYRGRNPFNAKRTVTICNGMYGRGTLGVVRALTDARFRNRNETFLARHFDNAPAFSILTRVEVVMGQALTPDWTQPDTRVHEWLEPEA
ncbi:helix-turn-helix domain-containing protein [Kibdelosporangium aridum]|uniref:Helix-turn-helix domain-containing protein n=1 Tax=Kibdelosporangium aridum TaxID=2030 RepID=A0A1Y5WZQ4_KIBAR|nr:helix-turn-helix transcriptional regulator [Kibdelosporangium aridum]SMC61647.1 Helix-turn-helix domain-containing protein [Kibdelosporangium aridum]